MYSRLYHGVHSITISDVTFGYIVASVAERVGQTNTCICCNMIPKVLYDHENEQRNVICCILHCKTKQTTFRSKHITACGLILTYLYRVPDLFHIIAIICKPLVHRCYPSEIILFITFYFTWICNMANVHKK